MDVVYEIIEFLGISPSEAQINKAIGHVDASLRNIMTFLILFHALN